MDDNYVSVAFQIILHAGNSKALIMEAVNMAEEGFSYEEVEAKVRESEKELNLAHQEHSKILADFANGGHIDLTLLLTHAQDHLMSTQTILDLSEKIIKLFQLTKTSMKQNAE